MKVAISGIRDLSEADLPVIEMVIADILSEQPDLLLFGGARGTDTVALAAACAILEGHRPPKLTVIVPKRLKDQPAEAQEWATECADEIIELKAQRLDPQAYRARNKELLRRSEGLVAFWDGKSGGTGMTIDLAHELGLPVEIIRLRGLPQELGSSGIPSRQPAEFNEKPWPHWAYEATPAVSLGVVTLGLWMAASQGLDRLSQFVRAMKAGTVRADETKHWARVISDVIIARPEMADSVAILPVPRRLPGRKNDMADLVSRIASETGKLDGTDLLIRVEEPAGGAWRAGRDRFDAQEHARTIVVDLDHPAYEQIDSGRRIILLDNVLTFGGTLEGARKALERDLPKVVPQGFSILVSGDYAIPS